jgi:membrane protein YdbS with pleckstrin-like domain
MEMSTMVNPEINLSDLPDVEAVTFLPVSEKYRTMRLALWGTVQLLLLAALLSPYLLYRFGGEEDLAAFSQWWWPVAAQAVLATLWGLEEWKGFQRRGYAVRDRDITYRMGWLFRSTTTVPFGMIQHSELSQGPVSRMMGLNHLKIFTAGGSGNLRIAGLAEEDAQTLRSVIEARTRR